MKILFINPFFPPWVPGGAEHSMEQMCVHFSRKGWSVEVLTAAFDQRCLDEERNDYIVRWVRTPYSISPGQNIEAEKYLRTNSFRQSMLNRFEELDRPDVIIANNAQVYAIAALLGLKYKIPLIGIVRDTQMLCEFGACMDNYPAKKAIPCRGYLGATSCSITFQRVRGVSGWRPIPAWIWNGIQMHGRRKRLRSIIRQFDHIVTISEALNLLVCNSLTDLNSNRISTIRNFSTQVEPAAKLQVMQFLDGHGLVPGRFFLFAGRKTFGKGADLLVAATNLAQRTIPDCRSLLLGRGKISIPFTDGCVDLDSISQNLLLGLLGQSAALVIPGRWQEGLHRTMIDALRLGIPIICTQAGAPPVDGVEHGGNGLVCSCNDYTALANSMVEILNWDQKKLDECRHVSYRIYNQRFSDAVNLNNWTQVLMDLSGETIHGIS